MGRMTIPRLAFVLTASAHLAFAAAAGPAQSLAGSHQSQAQDVLFTDSGKTFDSGYTFKIVLGDLDGDGDLDAFDADLNVATVWFNRGGQFEDSGQRLGTLDGRAAALGDLDGDGDLDAFVGSYEQGSTIWLNNGRGVFTQSSQILTTSMAGAQDVVLADLDRDGDLDAAQAYCGEFGGGVTIWLNDGKATFKQAKQQMWTGCTSSLAIGDFDRDGRLDIMIGNGGSGAGIEIWLNSRSGTFTRRQKLDSNYNFGIALGDLDGDGDLDAYVANGAALCESAPDRIWLNNGHGSFVDSGQRLGNDDSNDVALADLDRDGDLDTFVANGSCDRPQPDKAWMNDGLGHFSDSGLSLGNDVSNSVALTDLNGDGKIDALVGTAGVNRIYTNTGTVIGTNLGPKGPPAAAAHNLAAHVGVVLRPSPQLAVGRGSMITYTIVANNHGLGSAKNTLIHLPFDPTQLSVVDARFSRAGAWVSALLPDALEIETGPLGSHGDVVTATVRLATLPGLPDNTRVTEQLTYSWRDLVGGGSGRSNRAVLIIGSAADQALYPLAVAPDAAPAGSTHSFSSTIFAPGEVVTLWFNTPAGQAVAAGSVIANADGEIHTGLTTTGFAPGYYSMVAYGQSTAFTAVGPFQVL